MCHDEYNQYHHRAVRLPCNPKHILGFECTKNWYLGNARKTCPSCRAEAQLAPIDWAEYQDDWLKLELKYRNILNRWPALCHAGTEIPITAGSMLTFLRNLIVVERKLAPAIQPLRFNAGYFDRTRFLCEIVTAYVVQHNGESRDLQLIDVGIHARLTNRLREDDWNPPARRGVNVPYGFELFMDQTIRRMLVLEVMPANERPVLPAGEAIEDFEAITDWFRGLLLS